MRGEFYDNDPAAPTDLTLAPEAYLLSRALNGDALAEAELDRRMAEPLPLPVDDPPTATPPAST